MSDSTISGNGIAGLMFSGRSCANPLQRVMPDSIVVQSDSYMSTRGNNCVWTSGANLVNTPEKRIEVVPFVWTAETGLISGITLR